VNQIRKLDRVLNEEDRNVVADDVPVTGFGIQFNGKAAHVARQVGRTLAAGHRGESNERFCFFSGRCERRGYRKFG
jgi:hypothetical protein